MKTSTDGLPRRVAALLGILFVAVLVRTAWLSDDALITLRTVLNATHGFGLTFNAAERVQTYTHPLWMLMLTGAYLVVGNVYTAMFALSIATSLAAFWLALTRAASLVQAVVAAVLLLFSRAFVDFSTSGLENPLSCLLLALFAGVFFVRTWTPARRVTWLGVLTSLLYLARPDDVLFVLPLLALACWRVPVRTVARALAIGAVPALAWTAFAVIYYGFPFANTAYAKLGTGIARGEMWRQGVLYLIDSIDRDPLSLTAVAFALAAGLGSRHGVMRAWGAGIALYLVYVVSIGGDFMAGRFIAVPVFASALLLSRAPDEPLRRAWPAVAGLFAVAGLMSSHVPLLSNSRFDESDARPTGIVDERGFYFKDRSLVLASRSSFEEPDWPTAGSRPLRTGVLPSCGLLGSSGLDNGPEIYLLDECALADPLLARLPAAFNTNWRTGHYRRMIPARYEESVAQDANLLQDPDLRRYYDDLRLVTRSEALFTSARWRAILRLNVGRDRALIDEPFYRFSGSLVSLADVAAPTPDGTRADGPGTHALKQPLAIRCEDRPGRRYFDVALESALSYRILFLKGTVTVGSIDLGPIPEYRRQPGLVAYTPDVPPRAEAGGFDTVVVSVRSDTDRGSMGQFWLDGFSATQQPLLERVKLRDAQAQ